MLTNMTILLSIANAEYRKQIKCGLELEEAFVVEVLEGKKIIDIVNKKQMEVDLFLMDSRLPGYDNWTICREIRKKTQLPIVILSGTKNELDEIYGFELGIDDYLENMVNPMIVISHIQAILRRKQRETNHKLCFNQLDIDESKHFVRVGSNEVLLSPKEFKILMILISNRGKIITREELFTKVWDYNYYGGLRTVDTHINRLRKKLCECDQYIQTIRGFGYRFQEL